VTTKKGRQLFLAPAPGRDKVSRKTVSVWLWDRSDLGAHYAASNLLVSPFYHVLINCVAYRIVLILVVIT